MYCSGAFATNTAYGWHRVDHALMRSGVCVRAVDIGALYDGCDAVGVQYGPAYRTLAQAWDGSGSAAAARLQVRTMWQSTLVHPADLDDALCVGGLTSNGTWSGETCLPFAADHALLGGGSRNQWAVHCGQLEPFDEMPND